MSTDTPAPKRTKKTDENKKVVFRSFNDEPREFAVLGIRARRCSAPGRLEWHVDAEMADDFAKQFHVQSGRIVRV